jgi:hypothetical protein
MHTPHQDMNHRPAMQIKLGVFTDVYKEMKMKDKTYHVVFSLLAAASVSIAAVAASIS